MMRRLLVVLVAVVVVVIVSVTWWKASTRFEPIPAPNTADNGPPVEEKILDAGRDARLANSLQRSPGASVQVAKARHEGARAQAMRVTQVGHDKLLGRYQAETVDGGWASSREQSLTAHSVSPQIADLKIQPRNFTAQCRSATCRISADFATQSDAGDWFTLFLTNPGTDLANASFQTTPNPDGSAHAEIYGLAR